MVVPDTTAVNPGGKPLWAVMVCGVVPPAIDMVPVKLWPTVPVVVVKALTVGAGLMVMLTAVVTLAPAESVTVMLPLGKAPAALGVPVKMTLEPLIAAVRPVGRPLWA